MNRGGGRPAQRAHFIPWRATHPSARVQPVREGHPDRRVIMKWEQPTACDMRFGFEITMYIANR
jgi:coenzyme PQQ precursor peptide PqqA